MKFVRDFISYDGSCPLSNITFHEQTTSNYSGIFNLEGLLTGRMKAFI